MHLHSSEEATHFRARSIILVSALNIELADCNIREATCCPKSAADDTVSPSLEPSAAIQMLLLLLKGCQELQWGYVMQIDIIISKGHFHSNVNRLHCIGLFIINILL